MKSRVIYYYQTFTGLDKLLTHPEDIDVIIVSSIHFGINLDKKSYIHLNDFPPNNTQFKNLWEQLENFSTNSTDILLMIGGAGGAFIDLFNSYTVYYKLLKDLLKSKPFIKGIELDIEERVEINNVKMLINDLTRDFGKDFILTMAPVSFSMMEDYPGMGNFVYKDLYNSPEGKYINWFNVQSYGMFSEKTYKAIIDNGYPSEKIVMGMLWSDFDENTFNNALETIKNIKIRYPNMAGIDIWEYCKSPPNNVDPSQWAKEVKEVLIAYRERKWFSTGWLFN